MLSATPPKLQRIPRPGEKPITSKLSIIPRQNTHDTSQLTRVSKFSTVPHYVKVSDSYNMGGVSEPTKSIVGSVTTWFPPSSKIQLSSNNSSPKTSTDTMQSPRPQSITVMGDRKYLVIPKHSVLSVSPTIGAAVNTPSSRPLTSPTADKAPITDKNVASVDLPAAAVPTSACLGPSNPSSTPLNQPSTSEQLDKSEANSNTSAHSEKSGENPEDLLQPAQLSKE